MSAFSYASKDVNSLLGLGSRWIQRFVLPDLIGLAWNLGISSLAWLMREFSIQPVAINFHQCSHCEHRAWLIFDCNSTCWHKDSFVGNLSPAQLKISLKAVSLECFLSSSLIFDNWHRAQWVDMLACLWDFRHRLTKNLSKSNSLLYMTFIC